MAFVYIGNNEWINNSLSARVVVKIDFDEPGKKRIQITNIFDVSGLNVIYTLKTETPTHEYGKRQFNMMLDNERHNQIIVALNEGKNALEGQDLIDRVNELMEQDANLRQEK